MALTFGKPRLRLFYASDIHGSELVFRKFLNAAKFYGVDALIVEVHPHPEKAASDGPQSLRPAEFAAMMKKLARFAEVAGKVV